VGLISDGKLFDPMLVDIFIEDINEFLAIRKKYVDKITT